MCLFTTVDESDSLRIENQQTGELELLTLDALITGGTGSVPIGNGVVRGTIAPTTLEIRTISIEQSLTDTLTLTLTDASGTELFQDTVRASRHVLAKQC